MMMIMMMMMMMMMILAHGSVAFKGRQGKTAHQHWLCKYKLAKPFPLTLQKKEDMLPAWSLDEEVGKQQ